MTAVTVCVPAWNAEAFLAETLDSIAAQRFADIRVLISLDQSDDGSEAICRRYLADPRFQLVVQPRRLGWIGNVNFLIATVATRYFCIMPHDDVLDPRYIAELHALAAGDPAIANVYSDVRMFGTQNLPIMQPEVRGDRLRRVLDVVLNHRVSVAFRGLVRRRSPADRPLLRTTLLDGYGADTVWLVDLALAGELRRVPATLYRKRCSDGSVHAGWGRWPGQKQRAAWIDQAAACAAIATAAFPRAEDRDLVLLAALMRLLGLGATTPRVAAMVSDDPLEAATLAAGFCSAIAPARLPAEIAPLLRLPAAAPIVAARLLHRAGRATAGGRAAEAIELLTQARGADPLSGHVRIALAKALGRRAGG